MNEVAEELQEPEVFFIGDVGVFKRPKKVAKKKTVEIKEQAEKGGKFMFEILDSEADFDTAVEVKKDIEIEGEKVAMKKKKKKRSRNERKKKEVERGICGEGVVTEICAIGDFKWADEELQCVLEDERQVGAVTSKGEWVSMGKGEIHGRLGSPLKGQGKGCSRSRHRGGT